MSTPSAELLQKTQTQGLITSGNMAHGLNAVLLVESV